MSSSLKQAYLNAAALALFGVLGVIVYNNAVVFSSSLQSLFWAYVSGIFLHDIKKSIKLKLEALFKKYEEAKPQRPFLWILIMWPILKLPNKVKHSAKVTASLLPMILFYIISSIVVLGSIYCVFYFYVYLGNAISEVVVSVLPNATSDMFDGATLLIMFSIMGVTSNVIGFSWLAWIVFALFTVVLFLIVSAQYIGFFPTLIVSVVMFILLILGFFVNENESKPEHSTFTKSKATMSPSTPSTVFSTRDRADSESDVVLNRSVSFVLPETSILSLLPSTRNKSDYYFHILFVFGFLNVLYLNQEIIFELKALVIILFVLIVFISSIFSILVVYYLYLAYFHSAIKWIYGFFKKEYKQSKSKPVESSSSTMGFEFLYLQSLEICCKILPQPFYIFNLMFKGYLSIERYICGKFSASLDKLLSVFLILLLLVSIITGSIVFVFGVRHELVVSTKTIWLENVSNNSRFNEFWQSNYESINEKTNLLFHSSHSWLEKKLQERFGSDFNITFAEEKLWHIFGRSGDSNSNSSKLNRTSSRSFDFEKNNDNLTHVSKSESSILSRVTNAWKIASNTSYTDFLRSLSLSGSNMNSSQNITILQTIQDYISHEIDWNFLFNSVSSSLLIFRVPVALLSLAVDLILYLVDFIFSFLVFITALFIFLSDSDHMASLHDILIPEGNRASSSAAFSSIISGVMITSFKNFVFHFFVTMLTFSFCESKFVYIPSCLAAFFAVVPIVPCFLVSLPLVIHLWFSEHFLLAGFVFLIHFHAYWFVIASIQSEIEHSQPYLTALSIVGGLTTFGLQGVLIGPMLICFLKFSFEYVASMLKGDNNNISRSSLFNLSGIKTTPVGSIGNASFATIPEISLNKYD